MVDYDGLRMIRRVNTTLLLSEPPHWKSLAHTFDLHDPTATDGDDRHLRSIGILVVIGIRCLLPNLAIIEHERRVT